MRYLFTFPLGPIVFELNESSDYSTFPVFGCSAGTTMVGSFEVAKGLSWWPDGGATGPDSSLIHP